MTNGTSTNEITDLDEAVEEPIPVSRAEVERAPSGSWIEDFAPWLEPRVDETRSNEAARSPQYPWPTPRDVRRIVDEIKRRTRGRVARA
jgi:hypothetical protein